MSFLLYRSGSVGALGEQSSGATRPGTPCDRFRINSANSSAISRSVRRLPPTLRVASPSEWVTRR